MGAMASQITSLTIVYSTVYSGTDQRKHQSSASLAFVWRIHRWPVNSPHKWPVTRKMFPFDDVIMWRKIPKSCQMQCYLPLYYYILGTIMKFCAQHSSHTVVVCTKYQKNMLIEMDAMDERVFVRCMNQFQASFGRVTVSLRTYGFMAYQLLRGLSQ